MNQTKSAQENEIIESQKTISQLKEIYDLKVGPVCGTCKKGTKRTLFAVECPIFGTKGILWTCGFHEMDEEVKSQEISVDQSYFKINKTFHPEE